MSSFHYKKGGLFIENVSLEKIAGNIGLPFYAYSYKGITSNFDAFDKAFQAVPHLICFAVKANSNLSILRLLSKRGGGADIVSGGELHTALHAGVDPRKIVFAGVGKKNDEIRKALEENILMFNVESIAELEMIDKIGRKLKKKAPIAFRINLDIDPGTHPYLSTDLKENKFGLSVEEALEGYHRARDMANISIVGIHTHLGSQIIQLEPFVEALERLIELIQDLRMMGIEIHYLDIGGGLGIAYHNETSLTPDDLARALLPALQRLRSELDVTLILEPGKAIVGKAGILVTRALYIKKTQVKNFVIVDAGMNDLIRPSLYSAYHEVWPVKKGNGKPFIANVVGPVCESADFLAKDRVLTVEEGDLLAIMDVGAYGFSMSSNYNGRPRVAEVLVHEADYSVIRKRETYRDLWRNEPMEEYEGNDRF